jgi:hypothetical protein
MKDKVPNICEKYCQLYMYYSWNGEWRESLQNFNGETYWEDGDDRIILEWLVVESIGRCKLDWTVLNEMYLLHSNLMLHFDWFYFTEQWDVALVCIALGEMICVPRMWLVWDQTILGFGANHSHKLCFSCTGWCKILRSSRLWYRYSGFRSFAMVLKARL